VPLVPEGSDVVVIERAVGATTSDSVTALLCAGLDESATVKVKLAVPLAVGLPEIIPVDAARLSPDGSVPEVIVHLYGLVPPVALSVVLYAWLGTPAGSDVVPMARAAPACTTVRVTVADAV
jgi:hypothetical protein